MTLTIEIIGTDITILDADAIFIGANEQLLPGSGYFLPRSVF